MTTVRRLVLVFDADSGKVNALFDSARKLFKLKGCALCSITHGLAGERSGWQECKAVLGVPVDYVHRDEISGEIARVVGHDLPAVVAESDDGLEVLLGPDVLERCRGSVSDFKGLLTHASMRGLGIPEEVV